MDYIVNDTALTATADAIREKTESTDKITWSGEKGFADAISEISGGGGSVPDTIRDLVHPAYGAYIPISPQKCIS